MRGGKDGRSPGSVVERICAARMDSMEPSSGTENTPGAEGRGDAAPFAGTTFFSGANGMRAGWRLAIYIALVIVLGFVVVLALRPLNPFMKSLTSINAGELSALGLNISEIALFLIVIVPAWIMSRVERRAPGEYGIPLKQAFGARFWEGMLWGIVAISLMIGLITAFKGYSFGSIAQTRRDIFIDGTLFLVGFLFVGFFEEFAFRGYTQYTLASGIGFWPAAGILSGLFGGTHLFNQGEGLVGAASVFMIAMFFCLTLRRTGNLWFAIGLHCSFDWGETFLYSVPNSGTTAPGSLSHSTMQGARWLTGGSVGPEGSVFCFLVVALMFLIFHLLHPAKPE
jgi:uncharacterized protein